VSSAHPNLTIPYPGLRPFDEADHLLFFGRNEQTNELLMRLEDSAFVAVVGSSGSGKSSLVRAGLLPLLRDGFLFGTENWKIAVARPVNKPYQRLARKLTAFSDDVTEAEVLRLLRSSDDGLLQAVNAVCDDPEAHVLVVIDQFEELFGFRRAGESPQQLHNCASRDEAAAFVAMLLASARKSGDRLRIMITMRSDFVGDCEVFLGLPQAVSQSQFLVPRLTRSQMEEAITGPSRISQAGFEPFNIEPGLITTLTNDAGDRPDQLPLLQHALMRTWKLSDRNCLTVACYTKAGRIEKALSNDADDALNELDGDDRQLARQMFLLLCDISQEGQMTRRRPLAQEVMDVAQVDCADIERVMRVFQTEDRNFLLPPSPETIFPVTLLDISHEALLRQWGELGKWIDEEEESAKMYRRLADAAAEKRSLWRDQDLRLALEWRDQHNPTRAWAARYRPGFYEAMEFLKRSEEEQESELAEEKRARRQRIVRNVIAGLVLALLFLDPLGLDRKVIDDYYIGPSNARSESQRQQHEKLRVEHIVFLPKETIEHLEGYTSKDIDKNVFNSLVKNRSRGHEKEHIKHVLFASLRKFPNAVSIDCSDASNSGHEICVKLDTNLKWVDPQEKTEPVVDEKVVDTKEAPGKLRKGLRQIQNIITQSEMKAPPAQPAPQASTAPRRPPDPIFAVQFEIELGPKQRKKWAASGVVRYDPADFAELKKNLSNEHSLYAVAVSNSNSIDVVLPTDKLMVSTSVAVVALDLMGDPERVRAIDGLFRVLLHLIFYSILVFSIGIIDRKFAFGFLGAPSDSKQGQSNWGIQWRVFTSRVGEFSQRFQTRRWTVLLAVVFLLGAFAADAYGLDIGLILILIALAPTHALLRRSWACRVKAAQGIILQVGGYYTLAHSVLLVLSSSGSAVYWQLDLGLIYNPWLTLLVGIGLIIYGARKLAQANEEALVFEPDRAPVLYLRSLESAGQFQKLTLAERISRFFRPNDEDILRPIFGALGPFIALKRAKEVLLHLAALEGSAGQHDGQQNATEPMGRSTVLILQIDDRVTGYFYTKVKQALQTLRHDQVLLYFSHEVSSQRLSPVYQRFVAATRGMFPRPLPRDIDDNRVIAFREDWEPFLCGAIARPKTSWSNLMPLLGYRIDIVRMRRSLARALAPFFESRNIAPTKPRLFSDGAIGWAAFLPFGFGVPAGVMMFSNLWRMRRRWAACIGLIAPTVGFVGLFFMLLEVLDPDEFLAQVLVLLGYPFACYGLWRQWSGREIRRHLAFGGERQSRWIALIVLIGAGAAVWYAIFTAFENLLW
jgi:hypothetical protein